jgi:tetratricopeptide (TPR) repeat protein
MADDNIPVKEPEATPPVATAPEAPPPPKRRNLVVLARLGIFAGLFLLAIVASWIYREQARENEDLTLVQAQSIKSQGKKIASSGSPLESLARGDEALQRHFYTAALSHYEELLAGEPTAAPLVDYRFGLCLEALGQPERAIAAYRKAVSASSAPALACACNLGMARCFLQQNQPTQVRRLLYPVVLDETWQQKAPAPFSLDACYLIALAMARQTHKPAPARVTYAGPVSFVAVPLEIPFYLDDLGFSALVHGTKAPDTQTPLVVVQKRTGDQPALVLKADQTGQPALEVFDRLAKEGGLRIEPSAEAKKTIAERSVRLCLRNWPLLDLLEQLADSFDLSCTVTEDVVRLEARSELNEERLSSADRALAGRALRAATEADSSHPWAPAAYLELGNWEAMEGKLAEAAAWFERLDRDKPNSPYAAAASFNLAELRVRTQQFVRARQAFLHVIDHSPGHELALRSQIRIGQLYLEEDDVGRALVQFRRAQTLAPRSVYQPLATLLLAAACLQQAWPEQARAVLGQQRPLLQKEPYRVTAAFLDAYAQYRLAKSTNAGRREASELLSTLWRDQDETMLGPVGHCLMAEAYRDLGFQDQAERLLRRVAPQTHGPMVQHLNFLLGDTLLKLNRRDEAAGVFEKLAATPSPFRRRALWELARLDLEEKHYAECAQKCQELWAKESVSDQTALLQLWGAALEGAGDLDKAAQCFAGQAPK